MTKILVSWFKLKPGVGLEGPFTRNCKNNEEAADSLIKELLLDKNIVSVEKKVINKFDKIFNEINEIKEVQS